MGAAAATVGHRVAEAHTMAMPSVSIRFTVSLTAEYFTDRWEPERATLRRVLKPRRESLNLRYH